jgi:hypothetical protein
MSFKLCERKTNDMSIDAFVEERQKGLLTVFRPSFKKW